MKENNIKLKYISGIALIFLGIWSFWTCFASWELEDYFFYFFDFENLKYNIGFYLYVISMMSLIIAGVAIFIDKKLLVGVSFAAASLSYVYDIFVSVIKDYGDWWSSLLYSLPYLLIALIFISEFIQSFNITKKIWFLPAIIDLVAWLMPIFEGYDLSDINIFFMLIDTLALALAGLYWSKNNIDVAAQKYSKAVKKNEEEIINEIQSLKSLLDKNIISEEEFDEKKKRILNQ